MPSTSTAAMDALANSSTVIDLTAPLSTQTPVLPLPPEMAAIPHFELERLAHYDDD